VSRLEARLGAKLLHRTTRRLTLTSQGEAWLEHCTAALAQLDRGEGILRLSQNTPAGQVRIDLPTAFGRLIVMPVLLRLVSRCPAIQLKVSFSDGRPDLVGEGIDLAVRIGALDDTADLIARQLGAQQLVICAAPGYLAKRGTPSTPADLAEHDCIVGWQLTRHATWLLKQSDGPFAAQVIPAKHEFCDLEMVLAAARAGRGLAQLPLWMVQDDVQGGKLVTVLDGMSGGEVPITLLWPRTRALPTKVRVIVDELVKNAHRFVGSAPSE
jgi:DNA-binding transcriptional LysR family regulator